MHYIIIDSYITPSPYKGEGRGEGGTRQFLERPVNSPKSSPKGVNPNPASQASEILIVFLLSYISPLTLTLSPLGRGESGDME
jgi:hypothetical protein